ncbi:MAG TPA: EthD family reductase [Gemmatimonadales bacterium]|nr:EthD family reductase [Gemmatimonadales bacterium]
MRHVAHFALPAIVLASACSKPADQAPATADSTAAQPAAAPAAAAAPAGPQAIVTVLYNWPKDTAAFEKYYPTHLKIVGDVQNEIGFSKAELTKFVSTLDGKKPTYYRQAELYFPSMEAAKKGMATEGFKKVGDDLKNFASGGIVGLVATETGEKSDATCPALVTVIYNQPKDSAAFEQYYPTHLGLVGDVQSDIGFVRADLTKFDSSLDGGAPAKYRQAELCFPSLDAAKKGMATAGFKKVGDDLKNFATGGLVGLVGTQQ